MAVGLVSLLLGHFHSRPLTVVRIVVPSSVPLVVLPMIASRCVSHDNRPGLCYSGLTLARFSEPFLSCGAIVDICFGRIGKTGARIAPPKPHGMGSRRAVLGSSTRQNGFSDAPRAMSVSSVQ